VFNTADVVVPQRPTCKIKLGEHTMTARAPKTDVWRDVTRMLSKLDLAKELADAGEDKTGELAVLLADEDLANLDKMETAIITGVDLVDPETGHVFAVQGGFLRQCLDPEDWRKVFLEWKTPTSDLDTEHLFLAARALQEEFQAWFSGKEQTVGLPKSPAVKPARKR
jgi:hypothetical protein